MIDTVLNELRTRRDALTRAIEALESVREQEKLTHGASADRSGLLGATDRRRTDAATESVAGAPQPKPATGPTRRDKIRALLATGGEWTNAQIAIRTGAPRDRVSVEMAKLARMGHAKAVRPGVYKSVLVPLAEGAHAIVKERGVWICQRCGSRRTEREDFRRVVCASEAPAAKGNGTTEAHA